MIVPLCSTNCGRFKPGEPFLRGRDCALCWHHGHANGKPQPKPLGPCLFLGPLTGEFDSCTGCRGKAIELPTFQCAIHGECSIDPSRTANTVRMCRGCPDHSELPPTKSPEPLAIHRVNLEGYPLGKSERGFNASILRYQGRLLMAYRTDWAGAQIHVVELDTAYQPTGPATTLYGLFHATQANYGREDPRLFTYRGRLHVNYIGVSGPNGPTHQMYARLGDDLSVEQVFAPSYPFRAKWEKNWSPFEFEGHLLAVYATGPIHRIIRIDGDRAWPLCESPNSLPWEGGVLRGGASPVRTGDTFTHWFHGGIGQDRNVGVNVFEARPPFRVVKQTRLPISEAKDKEGNYCFCQFPCGAVLDGDRWLVSIGVNDKRIEVREWTAEAVEKAVG